MVEEYFIFSFYHVPTRKKQRNRAKIQNRRLMKFSSFGFVEVFYLIVHMIKFVILPQLTLAYLANLQLR